jgi:hypothetical protein
LSRDPSLIENTEELKHKDQYQCNLTEESINAIVSVCVLSVTRAMHQNKIVRPVLIWMKKWRRG